MYSRVLLLITFLFAAGLAACGGASSTPLPPMPLKEAGLTGNLSINP